MSMTNSIIKFRLVFFVFFFLFNTSPSLAAQSYHHSTAGFVIEIPTGWDLNVTSKGLERSQNESLLSFEYLGDSKVSVVDIMDYFLPKDKENSAFIGDMRKIKKPYSGLCTNLVDKGYAAEIAVLNTSFGYYLISLEQEKPDLKNKQLFEQMLKDFTLLDTKPFDDNLDLLEPVSLGSIDLGVPEGELELKTDSFIWKSSAGGLLSAEIITHKQDQPLIVLLDDWENNMLTSPAGLEKRTSKLVLSVDVRKTIIADYTGDDIKARVHVSAINKRSALVLALIARKKTFASHEQVLDAVSFSMILSENLTEKEFNFSSDISSKTYPEILTMPEPKSDFNSGDRKLYKQLSSGAPDRIRNAAKSLYQGHYQNASLLDFAATVLNNGYKKQQTSSHIDAMAWICRALGKSGQKKYLLLLKQVDRDAPSRKLKKYAKKAALQLR